jgi:hypothetical protein
MSQVILATKTKAAIEAAIEADQGAKFRQFLQKVLPHMSDAYRGEDEGFRSHLGASMIGKECDRHLWYGFHWAQKPKFSGRMIRLFNRGHLEEARIIASLLTIGVQVYQQDANGKQFRIGEWGGHFGGSGDGVGVGIPDLNPGIASLLEFKTHNQKSFDKLVKDGVKKAKPEHWAQMQVYMRKMGIAVALYVGVNKNDDDYHMELVYLDAVAADIFLGRAHKIIFTRTPPEKIHDSVGWFACKYCETNKICHLGQQPERNCRTCHFSRWFDDGTWRCGNTQVKTGNENNVLSKEQQLVACPSHVMMDMQ